MAITYTFVPKPQKLYHASQARGLTNIDPSQEKCRDPEEGAVVFATPSKAFSAVFLFPYGDDVCQSGAFDRVVYFVFKGTRRDFLKLDRGGFIYEVPVEKFQCDPTVGLGLLEWVSKTPVEIKSVRVVHSILEEMVEQGVQVFFVSDELFEYIKTAPDHGQNILESKQSENKVRGKYVQSLF